MTKAGTCYSLTANVFIKFHHQELESINVSWRSWKIVLTSRQSRPAKSRFASVVLTSLTVLSDAIGSFIISHKKHQRVSIRSYSRSSTVASYLGRTSLTYDVVVSGVHSRGQRSHFIRSGSDVGHWPCKYGRYQGQCSSQKPLHLEGSRSKSTWWPCRLFRLWDVKTALATSCSSHSQ